jgi:hypothetical protein
MCLQFLLLILAVVQCAGERSKDFVTQQLQVGVIDLRPKLVADRIYLIGNTDVNTIHKAMFPTIEQTEESNPLYDDNAMDQQAAAAHCIGSVCSTVYLMILYDFEHDKTVLHRSFGGTKLMSFVDGTRKSWQSRGTKMKLILLLLPTSTSSENTLQSSIITDKAIANAKMNDFTNDINYDTILRGAKVLLERLRSCFEYGGDEFQNIDPFDVHIILCGDHNWGSSNDGEVDDMVLDNHPPILSAKGVPEHFKDLINSSYQSASGSGEVNFIQLHRE